MLCKSNQERAKMATPAEVSPASVAAASDHDDFQPRSRHRALAATAPAPLKRCSWQRMARARANPSS
eukprot:1039807-Pyramimonas_sp.AAC.1